MTTMWCSTKNQQYPPVQQYNTQGSIGQDTCRCVFELCPPKCLKSLVKLQGARKDFSCVFLKLDASLWDPGQASFVEDSVYKALQEMEKRNKTKGSVRSAQRRILFDDHGEDKYSIAGVRAVQGKPGSLSESLLHCLDATNQEVVPTTMLLEDAKEWEEPQGQGKEEVLSEAASLGGPCQICGVHRGAHGEVHGSR